MNGCPAGLDRGDPNPHWALALLSAKFRQILSSMSLHNMRI